MASRNFLMSAIVVVTFVVCVYMIYSGSTPSIKYRIEQQLARGPGVNDITNKLIQQRNENTKRLNLKQQKVAQMECEKATKAGKQTSETGGWCEKESKENSGAHMTDDQLAGALATFFTGKTVASFGDGPGRYKQLILDSGKVKGYDAYDGAPFCDVTSEGRVQFLDLTLPQYGLPLYDWIISLEVAEHIPRQYESVYIDNIVRHAREGVVLSWAVPGQGGLSHVNNRPFEYVKKLFDSHGFYHDEVESQKLQAVGKLPWFKKNINVYKRINVSDGDKLKPFFI